MNSKLFSHPLTYIGIGHNTFFKNFNRRLEKFKAKTGLKSYMDVLNYLLSLDQLNMHRAEGKVLLGFEEPPIVFKPSYKFDPYTDIYDTGASIQPSVFLYVSQNFCFQFPLQGRRIEALLGVTESYIINKGYYQVSYL